MPLAFCAAGDHSFVVFEDADTNNKANSLDSLMDPKHGRGLRAVTLPTFSLLIEAVKTSDGDDNDAILSLEAAIDDLFTSPGMMLN